MYGKTVTLKLSEDTTIQIFVGGMPEWTADQWERRALQVLHSLVEMRMDSLGMDIGR